MTEALSPVIRVLQDAFVVELELDYVPAADEVFLLLTCTPSLLAHSPRSVVARHPIR